MTSNAVLLQDGLYFTFEKRGTLAGYGKSYEGEPKRGEKPMSGTTLFTIMHGRLQSLLSLNTFSHVVAPYHKSQ